MVKIVLNALIYVSLLVIPSTCLQLSIVGSEHQLGNITVFWTRDPGDTPYFTIQSIQIGVLEGEPHYVNIKVNDTSNAMNGATQIPIDVPGSYYLQALDTVTGHLLPLAADGEIFSIDNVELTSTSTENARIGDSSPTSSGVSSPNTQSSEPPITEPTSLVSEASTSSQDLVETSQPSNPVPVGGNISDSSNNTPVIVGSTIGSLAFLGLIFLLLFWIRRRSKAKQRERSISFYREKMIRPGRSGYTPASTPIDGPPHIRRVADIEAGEGAKNIYRFPSMTATASDEVTAETKAHFEEKFVPLTDRQMEVSERIQNLERQMIGLEDGKACATIRDRIERLGKLHTSAWALGRTDDVPPEMRW